MQVYFTPYEAEQAKRRAGLGLPTDASILTFVAEEAIAQAELTVEENADELRHLNGAVEDAEAERDSVRQELEETQAALDRLDGYEGLHEFATDLADKLTVAISHAKNALAGLQKRVPDVNTARMRLRNLAAALETERDALRAIKNAVEA